MFDFLGLRKTMLKVSAVAAVIAACADPASAFTVSLTRWQAGKTFLQSLDGEGGRAVVLLRSGAERKLAWTRLEDSGIA